MVEPELDTLETVARPLLELVERLTGFETTFVTAIDWTAQRQEVVIARNSGDLKVAEGSTLRWLDSMCRWSFLSGKVHTSDVPIDYPGSLGAEELGMQTFLALPIQAGDQVMGTVCGASREAVQLEPAVLSSLELISEALSFQLGALVERRQLRRRAEGAEALALIDPLTGIANRRGFDARFEEELARSGRSGVAVALLALDIDGFKAINDTYGHLAGDDVLRAAADVVRRTARLEDVAARVGGDEFVVMLTPGDARVAQHVASRIAEEFRAACERLDMPCTLSVGFSTSDSTPRSSLWSAADDALYRAKALRHGARPPAR
jgi:diguanylate cyclase